MNAFTEIKPADDLHTFLPGIGEEEYQLRAKIRTFKNCAAALIAKTDSDTARGLAWTCSHYATAHIYAGTDNGTLIEIARFCNRLMLTAMQAEEIDGGGCA